MVYSVSYALAVILFLLVDMIWLGLMVSRVYRPALGDLMASSPNILAAVVFYLLYPLGLTIFVIGPALKSGSVASALTMGALFGLFTYGTYDLTNQATLRRWPSYLTIIDVVWGTILGAVSAGGTALIVAKIFGAG